MMLTNVFLKKQQTCPLSLLSTGHTAHELHVICVLNKDILTSHPGHTAVQLLLQILKIVVLFYPTLRMAGWKTNNSAVHELYQLTRPCFSLIYLPQFYSSLRNSDYHAAALHTPGSTGLQVLTPGHFMEVLQYIDSLGPFGMMSQLRRCVFHEHYRPLFSHLCFILFIYTV